MIKYICALFSLAIPLLLYTSNIFVREEPVYTLQKLLKNPKEILILRLYLSISVLEIKIEMFKNIYYFH